MGFIQGCNMCKSQSEVGEINTNTFINNLQAKTLFENKIKKNNDALILTNNNISKIISQYNLSANKIELPQEVIETKPNKGFQTE